MMTESRNEIGQHRLDGILREALSGLEQPSLSEDFGEQLDRRLHREIRGSLRPSARRAMRAYWALFALASLGILASIGSPSPAVTWIIVLSLVTALLVIATPQFLFKGSRRATLLDLILTSIR